MSMSTGGSEGLQGDINVTPMVDVMLVLLIIFMVVTPMLLQGFTATLPQGVNLLERPADDARVTLGIDVAGQWYLNRERIRREDAPALLAAQYVNQPEDKVLFLKAHHDLPYEEIAVAMEVGRRAGARVLAAVSDPTPGSVQREPAEH
jgi:biopolymer transport protein ExbD/biopolymer transport protein TolR